MPEQTPFRKFFEGVRTKSTDTTRAFERIWSRRDHPDVKPILDGLAGYNLDPLDPPLEKLLRDHGLGDREIKHINDWPVGPKNDARAQIVTMLAAGAPTDLHFEWELHGDTNEATGINATAAAVTITFRSPSGKVRVWGAPTFGEVYVEV